MMYRWVTPWISTILAEKVWNKKHEKQNIKKEQVRAVEHNNSNERYMRRN